MRRLEHRVALAAVASLTPILLVLAWMLYAEPRSSATRWSVAILVVLSFAILIAVVRAQIDYPLRTLANLISALREEDYSIWARSTVRDDAMSEVTRELNMLTHTLRNRRFGEVEAAALVRSVVEHIDSAIFAFDERWRLRLVNRAGERLLARVPPEQFGGRTAGELGVEAFLTGDDTRTAEVVLPGGHGRFRIRRTTFREAASARPAVDVRPLPHPARGRAPGLAAHPARALARAEQLPRPHPLHRRQPRLDPLPRAAPRRLAGRRPAGPRSHRRALRRPRRASCRPTPNSRACPSPRSRR